ncbi:MAG: hypothetical protein QOJ21_2955 [Solirubrobacteraceae bacterium]|jgi:hypothetical protein|nr:hypothetical protein [Solirubrobacteraceae bacterium]
MSPAGARLAFEVLRFTAAPASKEVAVLELEGRFRAPARRRLGAPRLLAEDPAERLEVGAADGGDATADPDGATWRASFAVPLRILGRGDFALAVGRELLVDLPAPDREEGINGTSDLHVRLAREANALRGLADEAREAAAAALGRADAEVAERERLEAELRGQRHAREELATRLAQFEAELTARDETLEAVRREHAQALERLAREHGEELAHREDHARGVADERVAEAEAEAADLRRSLKSARADIELLRRERDRATDRAAFVRAEPATIQLPTPAPFHPEQEAAQSALPLPDGEEVGAARPVATPPATNGSRPGAHPDDDGDDDDTPTVAVARPQRRISDDREAEADGADAGWGEDETEGVRVLGGRRRRRQRGQEPPVEPLPGTAEIGARHIVAGDMSRGSFAVWLARAAAVLALAFVVAAVLMVVWGLR